MVDIMNVKAQSPQYRNPFNEWEQSSWIRSKPMRVAAMDGLPFPLDLVPLSQHPSIKADPALLNKLLAYRLLAHLQFTTVLELEHVNWVCSALARGQGPVTLNAEQRNDALRIYCDEGGHALFVELLSGEVEAAHDVSRAVLGRPGFDRTFDRLVSQYAGDISASLIRCFFVCVSETLVTKILRDIPRDPQVSSLVRSVIGDHAADEGVHSIYFHWYFPHLWSSLSLVDKESIGGILPDLVWTFLSPDSACETNVLRKLGFSESDTERILRETYQPGLVEASVLQAAQPTLRMFQKAGVLDIPAVAAGFTRQGLYVMDEVRR
jgi:P-aminobenzoate N-oxygenase AurF